MKCPICHGKGRIQDHKYNEEHDIEYLVYCEKKCEYCNGTGEVNEPLQTNEEWFANLSTEEKATYIFWKMIGFDMYDDDRVSARATSAMKEVVDNGGSRGTSCYAGIKAIESWLKEVHKE